MKKLIYIFMIGLISLTSCVNDILQKEPLDIIGDNMLWKIGRAHV